MVSPPNFLLLFIRTFPPLPGGGQKQHFLTNPPEAPRKKTFSFGFEDLLRSAFPQMQQTQVYFMTQICARHHAEASAALPSWNDATSAVYTDGSANHDAATTAATNHDAARNGCTPTSAAATV